MRINTILLVLSFGCVGEKSEDTSSERTTDLDGDGYNSVADGGADCDDSDAAVNPAVTESWYDGIDQDCDGNDADQDHDGYDSAATGGDDCDDGDASINPGATDTPYDGVDSDCGGGSDNDGDGDGYVGADYGGDDCDDGDPRINPGAEELWYDYIDQDCDGASDFDQDGDGHDDDRWGGDDCMDTDPDAYPGAYERPNDDVDQDCDGHDRRIDGVVLDSGSSLDVEVSFNVSGADGIELAVVLDTTASMTGTLDSLSASDIDTALAGTVSALKIGFATFDDYAYSSYGGEGTDLPYTLVHGMSDDVTSVEASIRGTSAHHGADGPESGMEGLYQALTGDGYDQDCDASFDSTTDVPPFLADAADPFGGTGGEAYDSAVSGIGSLGGLGFTGAGLPVVVLITDNYLRDPSAGYGTPGGCPLDASAADVETAATSLGAFIVGIANGTYPVAQLKSLATATGSLIDDDGDGVGETPAVWTIGSDGLTATIVEAVTAVAAVTTFAETFDGVVLQIDNDPYALVSTWAPASYTSVDTSVTSMLDFTITLDGTVTSKTAVTTTIELSIWGDGRQVGAASILVEVPPT
jgi:Putative metal-binding motif